jgi:hypothetical protein
MSPTPTQQTLPNNFIATPREDMPSNMSPSEPDPLRKPPIDVPPICGEKLQEMAQDQWLLTIAMRKIQQQAKEANQTITAAYNQLAARHMFGMLFTFIFLGGINVLFLFRSRKIKKDYLDLVEFRTIASRRIFDLQSNILQHDADFPVWPINTDPHESLWTKWVTWLIPGTSLLFFVLFLLLFF